MRQQKRESFVCEVIPHRATAPSASHALETAMLSLVQRNEPITLEIARTVVGKRFLFRARTEAALAHLKDQIQAHYPQALIRELPDQDDPLHLEELQKQKTLITGIELMAGAAAYVPLRTWKSTIRFEQGSDPILGVLAALDQVPSQATVISALSLAPIPAAWSRKYHRLALEHPLAEEQEKKRRQTYKQSRSESVSWPALIGIFTLVSILLLWRQKYLQPFLPSFVVNTVDALLQGQQPQLSSIEWTFLLLYVGGAILSFIVLVRLGAWFFAGLGQRPLYDQRQIAEKIRKSAYRARLRLFVVEGRADHRTVPLKRERWKRLFSQISHVLVGLGRRARGGLFALFSRKTWQRWRILGKTLWRRPSWIWWRATPARASKRVWHAAHLSLSLARLWWRDRRRQWIDFSESLHLMREQRRRHLILLERLIAAYNQFHTADAYFVPRKRAAPRSLSSVSGRRWPMNGYQELFLSGEEVGVLWHLPAGVDLVDIAWVEQRQERSLPVPQVLTRGNGWQIGHSTHANQQATVYFPPKELSRHAFVLGRTGRGKSTLFEHLALARLASPAESGLCVVEPHGDLVFRLLGHLGAEQSKKVTLINLAHLEYPPGINPLDMSQGVGTTDKISSSLLQTLKRIWHQSWGSRIENVMRYSLRTLSEANLTLVQENAQHGPEQQYTLLDVIPLLTKNRFRTTILSAVKDVYVLDWWKSFYNRLNAEEEQNLTIPIITKISAYASSPVARRIVGQPRSTIQIKHVLGKGGILLVNSASGVVGQEIASMLGATILGLLSEAIGEQVSKSEERTSWGFLIDEFGNYPVNYLRMMAELRKAGLTLTLATQSLAQVQTIEEELRSIILSNADLLFTFTLAGDDAWALRHEYSVISPEDIVALPDYTCYVRLPSAHGGLPPFSLRLALPPPSNATLAQQLLQDKSAPYSAEQVDRLLLDLAQRHMASEDGASSKSKTGDKGRSGNKSKWQQGTGGPKSNQKGRAGSSFPFGSASSDQNNGGAHYPFGDPPGDDANGKRV